jgi:hypothetical protein
MLLKQELGRERDGFAGESNRSNAKNGRIRRTINNILLWKTANTLL